MDDFVHTIERLKFLAGSLSNSDDIELAKKGYKCIKFKKHRYILVYKLYGKNAIIVGIFHAKENYSNKMFV